MKKALATLGSWLALIVPLTVIFGPILLSGICGAITLPGRRRYCTPEQMLAFLADFHDYLRSGGDLRLWIPLAVLAFAAWGYRLEVRARKHADEGHG